jgi:hypothetical protein
METAELVAAVKAYAIENYTEGGWDVIVEAWDDAEIAETIGRATTVKGALAKFADVVDVYSDRQAYAAQEREPAPSLYPLLCYRPVDEETAWAELEAEGEASAWWLFQDVSPSGSQAIWYG